MKKLAFLVCTTSCLLVTAPCLAYEVATHEDMSEAAAFSSVLTTPEPLSALGLTGGIDDPKLTLPNSEGKPKTIKFLIRDGANFEDSFPRPANHFFDPLTGKGLAVGSPSPDWAIDGTGDSSTIKFSFKAAREYLWQATANPLNSYDYRQKQFGLMFETLGHVIHHIQDMAQPQHVRNDLHCDRWYCVPLGKYSPSAYEKYTDREDIRPKLPFSGYDPVYSSTDTATFNTARKFWTTTINDNSGMGIAEFTNRNFVSAGTNFKSGKYTLPAYDPLNKQVKTAAELCLELGAAECAKMPGLSQYPNATITFYGTQVTDTYRPQTNAANPRASSESAFDEFLIATNKDPAFTLNRFNFDAAHQFLIPRAVAYSAGLINYFFRGKLEISLPEEGVYGVIDHNDPVSSAKDTGGFTKLKLKVKNVTPKGTGIEPMTPDGKLVAVVKFHRNNCYNPDLSGEYGSPGMDWHTCRGSDEEIVVSSEASAPAGINADPSQVSFSFPTPIPINGTDLILQVVYKGPLGDEPVAVVVATKDISEPTYIYNYSRWDQYVYYEFWPFLNYNIYGSISYARWCTGAPSGSYFPPFPSVEACNQATGDTVKMQYSPSPQPVPGYDPAISSLVMGQWYDLSREPPLSPIATLVAPVGNLARIAVLLDAVPSNMALRVYESIDTTHQSQLFNWQTGTAMAQTSQWNPENNTLIPSVHYLPGRGVYLPDDENALLTSGGANPMPPLVPIRSQISPSW